MSTCPENVGQIFWGQRHQILLTHRHTYTTLRSHDVREDTNYRSHRRISFKYDGQPDWQNPQSVASVAAHQVTLVHPLRYDAVFHNAPVIFIQLSYRHFWYSLSSTFHQLSTRFTQTHASLRFNECWCNRGSDELAVNQGLVNVNELPIVGVGKVGGEGDGEGEMCVCVFVTGCSNGARKRDVHRITRSTETHIFCAVWLDLNEAYIVNNSHWISS